MVIFPEVQTIKSYMQALKLTVTTHGQKEMRLIDFMLYNFLFVL